MLVLSSSLSMARTLQRPDKRSDIPWILDASARSPLARVEAFTAKTCSLRGEAH